MSSKLESTKKLIRSVLTPCKQGVQASQFLSDYFSLTRSKLQFEKLGFKTLQEFIRSIPDVVKVSYRNGTETYHAVASSDTKHIEKLVAKQNTKKKRSKSLKYSSPHQRFGPKSTRGYGRIRSSYTTSLQRPNSSFPSTARNLHVRTKGSGRVVINVSPVKRPLNWTRMVVKASKGNSIPNPEVAGVVKNRIKTILGLNREGIFANKLPNLYHKMYQCELSETVLHMLEGGALENVARIEKLASGNRERCIFYPYEPRSMLTGDRSASNQVSPKVSEPRANNLENGKITVAKTVKDRSKALLEEHPEGISVCDDLEYGQINKLARVEKHTMGNGETTLVDPLGTVDQCSMIETNSNIIPVKEELDESTKEKIRRILVACTKGLKLLSLEQVFSDTFKEKLDPKDIDKIARGALKGFADVKNSTLYICTKSKIPLVKERKYPALSSAIHNDMIKTYRKKSTSPISTRSGTDLENIPPGRHLDVANDFKKNLTETKRKIPTANEGTSAVRQILCAQNVNSPNVAIESLSDESFDYSKNDKDARHTLNEQAFKPRVTYQGEKILSGPYADVANESLLEKTSDNNLGSKKNIAEESVRKGSIELTIHAPSSKENFTAASQKCVQYRNSVDAPIESLPESKGKQLCRKENAVATNYPFMEICVDHDQKGLEFNPDVRAYVVLPTDVPFCVGEFGKFFRVSVTKVYSLDMFYMVPDERKPILENLTCEMNRHYLNSKYHGDGSFVPGGGKLYAALCKTGDVSIWRRVTIRNILPNFASVFLVDVGILDCVPVKLLRKLDHSFANLPFLAMAGRLFGIKFKDSIQTNEVLDQFKDLVMDRQLVAHMLSAQVVEETLVSEVCLYVEDDGDGKWINDAIVEEWNAADFI